MSLRSSLCFFNGESLGHSLYLGKIFSGSQLVKEVAPTYRPRAVHVKEVGQTERYFFKVLDMLVGLIW